MKSEQAPPKPIGATPLWRAFGIDFFVMYGILAFVSAVGDALEGVAKLSYVPVVAGLLFALIMIPDHRKARTLKGQCVPPAA
jgi:hypothetical protein